MKTQNNRAFILHQNKYLPIKYSGNRSLTIPSISMTVGGKSVTLEIPVPSEKVTAETMLPLFQALTNFLVEMSVKAAEKKAVRYPAVKVAELVAVN